MTTADRELEALRGTSGKALIVLQFGLFALNLRGISKTEPGARAGA